MNTNSLKIVVLNNWFYQNDNSLVNKYFSDIMNLKRIGYNAIHSDIFLPVSVDDFFCYHCAICDEKSMKPLVVFKVTSYNSSIFHKIQFPFLAYLKEVMTKKDFIATESYLMERINKGQDISYSGGWTRDPNIKDKDTRKFLNDVYTGIHVNLHQEYSMSTITGFGIVEFKTDVFFEKIWGLKKVINKMYSFGFGSHFHVYPVANDLSSLSIIKLKLKKDFLDLWEKRIDLTVQYNNKSLIQQAS